VSCDGASPLAFLAPANRGSDSWRKLLRLTNLTHYAYIDTMPTRRPVESPENQEIRQLHLRCFLWNSNHVTKSDLIKRLFFPQPKTARGFRPHSPTPWSGGIRWNSCFFRAGGKLEMPPGHGFRTIRNPKSAFRNPK